jgi:hypothetical protein
MPPPSVGASKWLRFSGDAGQVVARVDATFDRDFQFAAEAPKAPPAGAGDMMIF